MIVSDDVGECQHCDSKADGDTKAKNCEDTKGWLVRTGVGHWVNSDPDGWFVAFHSLVAHARPRRVSIPSLESHQWRE